MIHLKKPARLVLAVFAILSGGGRVNAAVIQAEGVASIKPAGVERARQMAIVDARQQASLEAGVGIEMASTVDARGIQLESSRVRPAELAGKVTILREWQEGDDLHVRISVETDASGTHAAPSSRYKKKITATPFTVRKSYVTDDIDNASHGLANELLRRLEDQDRFLTRSSEYTLPASQSGRTQNAEAVVNLANMYDSQFVISGEIVDAGISEEGGYLGVFRHQRRRFEIDVFVYDGLTGALIARHRIEKSALDDVAIGRDKPFGSASFHATKFGKAISQAIDEAAAAISRDLANLPFTARVLRISGDRIYIDAGGTSLVAPGDRLVAYRVRKELPLPSYGSSAVYGISETPVATVSVVQVQPKFSICALPASAKGVEMEVGDFVRFDMTDRRPDSNRPDLF